MELLADDEAALTVQAITDRADVGVGSFYNYFSDKQDVLDQAVVRAFTLVGEHFVRRAARMSDPVERFSTQVRLFIQAVDIDPVAARILVKSFPEPWLAWEISSAGTTELQDRPAATVVQVLAAAVAAGRLFTPRPDHAVLMVGSGAVALIARRLADPTITASEGDDYTATALIMLGMDPAAAHEMAHRPLPEDPAVRAH